MEKFSFFSVLTLTLALALGGCGKGTAKSGGGGPEDSSASGAAAAAVGGALSGSSSGGTQALLQSSKPQTILASVKNIFEKAALAAGTCPTFKTIGAGCNTSGGTMWLAYSGCNFGASSASWTGTQALIMSAGAASCGSFPNPGAGNSLVRQMVLAPSSTTPSAATVTTSFGTSVGIDHATANLGNFNGDIISSLPYGHGGYGFKVLFNGSGARSALNLAEHISGTVGGVKVFDHTINGGLVISETAGASSRVISGSVSVYHNLVKVIGTSTFNNVTHTDSCCLPTAGSITTTFAAGSNVVPTLLGAQYVGNTETLTFTGCGTATLVDVIGKSTNVTLSHCM